ncbi:2-phosphosulfolactate phosphatase [Azohydromonas aeria]|uniref:2-phosphosulfolactate phosphatase n=1 Tax=Azohydromonas aeria TaxID=2590212 RepID=UPI0012FB053B|nr:2-phosphosulfolactate phosphatase [Azohydromonas aeria]
MKVHVLTRKEEIDPLRLAGKVVVVLDVLFATTTMAAALDGGCTEVLPMPDGEAARAALQRPDAPSGVAAGEWMAQTLPGFVAATPLAVLAQPLSGRRLVYSTTNGTVALLRARGAAEVLAGALVNAAAVVRYLLRVHPERTVVLACAGSAGRFNLEDFYGAGCLVSLLREAPGPRRFSDSALAAALLYTHARGLPHGNDHPLWQARVGQRMVEKAHAADLSYAARESVLEVVPRMDGERLVLA